MMLNPKLAPFLLFCTLLSASCKKDKDVTPPSIHINLPGAGTVVTVPDTLMVSVHVSDDQVVRTVWISLADDNGVPIAPGVSVQLDAASGEVDRMIIVNNENIVSGTYSLAVRASDGENTSSAFRSVQVLEAPLRLRSIIATPLSGGTIYRVDSVGTVSPFTDASEITHAAINSRSQELFVAAGSDPLRVFSLNNGADWQLPNNGPGGSPYFTSLHTDLQDDRTYISSSDGAIRAFRGGSTPVYTAQALPSSIPYLNASIGDVVLNEQVTNGTAQRKLVNYTYSAGAVLNNDVIDLEVIGIFEYSGDQALIFGNRNGSGVIQLQNVTSGGNLDLSEFTEGQIRAVAQISSNAFTIVLPNRVVRYESQNNSSATLISTSATDVAFDEANGSLLIATGQEILVVHPVTGSVVNTILFPITIGRVLPLFNR
jgi:hypothetical protein